MKNRKRFIKKALEISYLGLQNNSQKYEILELLHIHSELKQTLIGSKIPIL